MRVELSGGWRSKVYNLLSMLAVQGKLKCLNCGASLPAVPYLRYTSSDPNHVHVYVVCKRCRCENYLMDIIRQNAKDLVQELTAVGAR